MFRKQFTKLQAACAFAEAIVNTVREPLVVLDHDLRVVAASRSFYRTFKISPKDTEGGLLYEFGDGVLYVKQRELDVWRDHPDALFAVSAIRPYVGPFRYVLGTYELPGE